MAVKEWFAPGNNTNYIIPAGNIRFRIWYEDTSSYTKNLISNAIQIKPVKFPFEVTPSSNRFRYANFNISFQNINNEFENENIFDLSRDTETYFDVYFNDQIIFTGIVDYNTIRKVEWYDDNGLKYRKIHFTVLDRLAYLALNSVTLGDVSYSNSINLYNLFDNIRAAIKVSNLYFDSNLKFDEYPIGSDVTKNYLLQDLYINRQDNNTQVIDFLKSFMVKLGVFIYTWQDTLYVVSRVSGPNLSIDKADIIKIDQIENYDAVSYVKIESTITTDPLDPDYDYLGSSAQTFKDMADAGVRSNRTKRNYEVDATGILDQIFSLSSADQYGPYTAETIDENSVYDTDSTGGGSYFHYNDIECGDTVRWDFTGSYYNNISMIKNVPSQTQADFYRLGATGTFYNTQYDMWRGSGSAGRRYKQYHLVKMVWQIYKDYFLTDRAIIKISLKKLENYIDIYKKFVLDGNNYRVKSASYDFMKDKVLFELRRVP